MVGYDLGQEVVLDARRQAVGARQDKVDLNVAALLLGLQLAGQFGRSCGRVGDVVDDVGMSDLEILDHPLGKLKVARDVKDVDGDGSGRNLHGGRAACAG